MIVVFRVRQVSLFREKHGASFNIPVQNSTLPTQPRGKNPGEATVFPPPIVDTVRAGSGELLGTPKRLSNFFLVDCRMFPFFRTPVIGRKCTNAGVSRRGGCGLPYIPLQKFSISSTVDGLSMLGEDVWNKREGLSLNKEFYLVRFSRRARFLRTIPSTRIR